MPKLKVNKEEIQQTVDTAVNNASQFDNRIVSQQNHDSGAGGSVGDDDTTGMIINIESDEPEDKNIQFRTTNTKRKEIQEWCIRHEMSHKQMFIEAFDLMKKKYGA